MVKITFQTVSAQKPDKEIDGDKIIIPQAHKLILPVGPRKTFPTGLCCLTFGLVVFMSGLMLASIYMYRYYFIPQIPEDSLFHCRVVYEDSVFAPTRGRQEIEENVGIYLDDNYEQISVPVPHFGGSDPADIIHDFHRGLTAYHDIALDKCYITELNTTLVMPPRNLWELLVNVKRGTYLPQTYIIQEDDGYREGEEHEAAWPLHPQTLLRQRNLPPATPQPTQTIDRRETKTCHRIRHFENTFVVETVICDRF
ncbi:hypothetical protein F7725_011442 [Dissostichus mawsoni]|uniref:Integral membrane protein 2 n=1 Tax=Dissostichus mawsoni TaxID=36200 RepID=A0A7J5ZAP0_DISMA|nr:hypothetical protein F7725_011442 [Dissostichus mawsoni]